MALVVAIGLWAEGDPRKHILVLHSYSERNEWTRSIGQGIAEGLAPPSWDLWYEYLDAKNLAPGFDFSSLDAFFRSKYAGHRFDLVITVDDAAYDTFVRTRDEIFHGAPVLAIGLNSRPTTRLSGASYLLENPRYGETIDWARKQFPTTQPLHIVLDRTPSGLLIRGQIEGELKSRPVAVDWIDSGSADQIVARCGSIPVGEVLIYGLYFDPAFGYVSSDWLLSRIRTVARVPIFAFWSFAMKSGAFGGYLYDGYRLGLETATQARVMVEEGGNPVFVDPPLGRWMFDWTAVQSLGLEDKPFPEGTLFLNRPPDVWTIDRTAVIAFLVSFAILGGFALLILANLRAKHHMVTYSQSLIATQRELMASLGDVIETRSQETASHVQRITRLAVALARFAGGTEEDLQHLDICASMHDIGKVGIPDSILKNPGRLTEAEMAIMRTHTTIGHSIFNSSPNPVFRVAATIALEHHERWDGAGYPQGKAGDQIHWLARIVSVVDVFDALLTERVYKPAWGPEEVRTHIEAEAGRAFDPELTRIFLSHWDEFCALRLGDKG